MRITKTETQFREDIGGSPCTGAFYKVPAAYKLSAAKSEEHFKNGTGCRVRKINSGFSAGIYLTTGAVVNFSSPAIGPAMGEIPEPKKKSRQAEMCRYRKRAFRNESGNKVFTSTLNTKKSKDCA